MKRRTILMALVMAFNLSLPLSPAFIEKAHANAEPEVVIRDTKDKQIIEYRINGFLYAVRVNPKNENLPSYYLVRAEDGQNFIRTDQPDFLIPKWKILEW